jgi:hypothetical protein
MATVESSPGVLDINLYRGDTYYFTATVKNADDTPMDLTGYSIKAEIYNGSTRQPMTFTNTATVIQRQKQDGVATLTFDDDHNFDDGQIIEVEDVGITFDGTRTVSSYTNNTISYSASGANVSQENVDPVGTVTASVKAEFQVGTTGLTNGIIYLYLPDGISSRLPTTSIYDIEISKKINRAEFGDSPTNTYDDHWFVQTILKGTITMTDDVTYSVTEAPDTRGQLT